MQIQFAVGGKPVEFRRDQITGRAELVTPDEIVVLQSPFNPLTHFSFRLTQNYAFTLDGHEIVIEKKRPLLFAGFRPCEYRVLVNGALVCERSGY